MSSAKTRPAFAVTIHLDEADDKLIKKQLSLTKERFGDIIFEIIEIGECEPANICVMFKERISREAAEAAFEWIQNMFVSNWKSAYKVTFHRGTRPRDVDEL